jgi:hypothetical protein
MVWPLVSLVLGNNQRGSLLACGWIQPSKSSLFFNFQQLLSKAPPNCHSQEIRAFPLVTKSDFRFISKLTLDGLLELISDFQGTIKSIKTDIQS